MYRISEIKLRTDEDKSIIPRKIEKKLGKSLHGAKISAWNIVKESLDARDKQNIRWIYTVDFDTEPHIKLDLKEGGEPEYMCPQAGTEELKNRPVICGFGPAGMFCALILAEQGYRPTVIERGRPVRERAADVERFWKDGILNTESNVQFGEGGAGTFSDGKLTTGIKDIRIRKVLREFVNAGAKDEILYKQKPHIGTDMLRIIVTNIRKRIERLGGEVIFSARLDDIETEDGRLTAVIISEPRQCRDTKSADYAEAEKTDQERAERTLRRISTDVLVLAAGHSARDTVRKLHSQGLLMEQKPFSIGVRIEHPQKLIDIAQYGKPHEELGLPPAEYKLSCRNEDGRGVYTFCMCPGGEVIAASSQNGMTATNGMSYSARSGKTANSALLVDVRTSDFADDSPLSGMDFQEKYERLAFENAAAANRPPRAAWAEFLQSAGAEKITAGSMQTVPAGLKVRNSLPDFAVSAIEEAMPKLAKKLKDFDSPDAVLTAVESRSSSPVRIPRDENHESNIKGIYPTGEGAGYAGGIMSAAVDGIRTAEIIISKYKRAERG